MGKTGTKSKKSSLNSNTDTPGNVRIGKEQVTVIRPPHLTDPACSPFELQNFKETVQLQVQKLGKNFMEFDLVGVDCSVSNSIRRVMINEVPTMAIEHVFVVNNTSIIPDEVLAHRLGLVPIHADPRKFDMAHGQDATDVNTIVFELHSKCSVKFDLSGSLKGKDPKDKYDNSVVYSSSIKWSPQGSQGEVFASDPIRPSLDDIILTKMRPGQELDLELHAVKGVGKDHAKWSPVSCAYYRLLPNITITKPITNGDAEKFAKCFPKDVIEIDNVNGVPTAVVNEARKDTVSRECLRHPEFADKVVLSRVHDHFIFHLETVGFYGPLDVVKETLKILSEKCSNLRAALEQL